MSATIMMPQAFDQAISEMCTDAMSQAVTALAEKYGFDVDEASRFLELESLKIARKRGPLPKQSTEKPVTKKPKAKKDETKPKRAPTGYLMYSKDVRALVKEELTAALGEDEKLKPQAVVSAIAVRWKALSEDDRGEWNTKAKTPVVSDEE